MGKFIFHFADGSKMKDRNKMKTLGEAKSWVSSHNRGNKTAGRFITKVSVVKPTKKRTNAFAFGRGFKL